MSWQLENACPEPFTYVHTFPHYVNFSGIQLIQSGWRLAAAFGSLPCNRSFLRWHNTQVRIFVLFIIFPFPPSRVELCTYDWKRRAVAQVLQTHCESSIRTRWQFDLSWKHSTESASSLIYHHQIAVARRRPQVLNFPFFLFEFECIRRGACHWEEHKLLRPGYYRQNDDPDWALYWTSPSIVITLLCFVSTAFFSFLMLSGLSFFFCVYISRPRPSIVAPLASPPPQSVSFCVSRQTLFSWAGSVFVRAMRLPGRKGGWRKRRALGARSFSSSSPSPRSR